MPSHPGVSSLTPWTLLLPPAAVTALLWLTRASEITPTGVLCAFLLFLFPWGSFLAWRQGKKEGLPTFAMLGFVYWLFFAIGLFWLGRELSGNHIILLDPEIINEAVWLALVGVLCMGLGMRVPIDVLAPSRQLELTEYPTSWIYVRLILVAGTLGSFAPRSYNMLGAEGLKIMEILLSTVPAVALLLLLQRCLTGRGTKVDRVLLWVYFPIRIVGGLASGWMSSAVSLGIICGAMYFLIRRKIPWGVVAVSVVAVLFLQVGKKDFRNLYWEGGGEAGLVEKVTFWISGSALRWSEAMNSENSVSIRELSRQSLERTTLLPQVAHVLDLTPSQIPFQMGQTYSYLPLALIPRFLWPDKPSASQANRYYQVAYGLNTWRDVDNVSIGVGCLGEAYINFGWPGVFGIMFLIGVVLGIYERSFVARNSSTLFLAIGIALLPGILNIEQQMAMYLGGVVQTVLLTILVFLPVARRGAQGVSPWRQGPNLAPVSAHLRVRPN